MITVTATRDLALTLRNQHGGERAVIIPAGEILTLEDIGTGSFWIKSAGDRRLSRFAGDYTASLTYAEVHKNTAHTVDLVNTCPLCEGSGEKVTTYTTHEVTSPCKNCKGRGYHGRKYAANAA